MKLTKFLCNLRKSKSSEVLSAYLKHCDEPPWTSYFIKVSDGGGCLAGFSEFSLFQLADCENDLKGKTSFNFTLDTGANYHILRTWCYPYIKFHCTKSEVKDLSIENKFYELIKVLNLGIPLVLYGVAAIFLIKHDETVDIPRTKAKVKIYFLIPEEKGSRY